MGASTFMMVIALVGMSIMPLIVVLFYQLMIVIIVIFRQVTELIKNLASNSSISN